MAKFQTVYVCQSCGATYSRWQGQCNQCQAWNSLVEEVMETRIKGKRRGTGGQQMTANTVVRLAEIEDRNLAEGGRRSTGSQEFDRVLGGGIVPGSVVLVAGEPGVGKSTLLTQLALRVAPGDKHARQKTSILYVCGEESPSQVGLRVHRLDVNRSLSVKASLNIRLLAETDVDAIVQATSQEHPALLIVDSIQTLSTQDLSGMSGSVGQVRESANRLIAYAKHNQVPVMLVGHVTKEGTVAGPKVLEHMVDAVLSLEGDKSGLWRILKAQKNRFGATDEVGVFAMDESGLADVSDPASVFLGETPIGVAGSAVAALLEGTRTMLVEIQALAVYSPLAMPRRVAQGVPATKLQLITAILAKHGGLPLADKDVFVNVAGGFKTAEPAVDLAMAVAIASSVANTPLPPRTVFAGEVGLLGEIRQVVSLKKRMSEAKRLGYPHGHSSLTQKTLRELLRELGLKKAGGKR